MNNALGKNWILLRGLARESAHWGDFAPVLRARFPEARITALDLPGTGRYFRDLSPFSIPAIVEIVRKNAREQGLLEQPVTLLGLSLGGMAVWEWLQKYPADVSAAALLSTSFGGFNPFYERLSWRCYGKFFALVKERDLRKREWAILQLLNNNRALDEKLISAWVTIQKERPVSPANLFRQLVAAAIYCPGPDKPDKPVLLLNSMADRMVDPSCSETIREKWRLELKTHSWAGHDLTTDDGEWVALQLHDWLMFHQAGL